MKNEKNPYMEYVHAFACDDDSWELMKLYFSTNVQKLNQKSFEISGSPFVTSFKFSCSISSGF